jgi:beta-lactamase superfamily II metal-dependent hydrolase
MYSPVKADGLDQADLLLLSHNEFDHFGDVPEVARW